MTALCAGARHDPQMVWAPQLPRTHERYPMDVKKGGYSGGYNKGGNYANYNQ